MEDKILQKICIVGGGSAGWLTALSLSVYLKDIETTIVIPKKYSNIGVGESTQRDLLDLLQAADINLFDFINKTSATLKHGIYYNNWNQIGKDYWHPFSNINRDDLYSSAHCYHALHDEDPDKFPLDRYYETVHDSYTLCVKNNKSSINFGHALHVDSDLVASYLNNHLKNKINILNCEDFDIEHDNKSIVNIVADNTKINADLYIDCTGFSKLLISKVSDCVDDGYEGNVNSAIFARIPYNSKNVKSIPYTRADAFDYGWIWTIPLQHRVGSGCVYNDKFCSEEQAKKYFIEYWEGCIKEQDLKKISFSSKSLLKPWHSNVVAIGLSSGFIEPLEATGINWFIQSANTLCSLLKNRSWNQNTILQYNSTIRRYIEDVQDFIDVHYMLSSRRDTEFWKYQTSRDRNIRLTNKLSLYKEQMPTLENRNLNHLWAFNDVSWIDILTGYNFKFNTKNIPKDLISIRFLEMYNDYNRFI